MRKAGWLKAVTPMADETYDPLNRAASDEQVFGYNQDMLTKGQTELDEWKEMETSIKSVKSPSAKTYR